MADKEIEGLKNLAINHIGQALVSLDLHPKHANWRLNEAVKTLELMIKKTEESNRLKSAPSISISRKE